MLLPYAAPRAMAEAEEKIKKSVFIGRLFPVKSEEDVQEILGTLKTKERDATHHVFAWRLGTGQILERSSDGGEPRGTAGHPLLHVLKEQDLTNSLLVVTRYFGGIKLGAGGLTRAYASTGAAAVNAADIVMYTPYQKIRMTFPYSAVGAFENYIKNQDVRVVSRTFEKEVAMTCLIPGADVERQEKAVAEMTDGKALFSHLGEEYVLIPRNK